MTTKRRQIVQRLTNDTEPRPHARLISIEHTQPVTEANFENRSVPSSADPAGANEALSAACATVDKSEVAGNMSVRLLQVGKQQVAVTCSIDGVVANSASGVRGGVLAGLPVRRRGWVGGSHTIAAWYQQRNPGRPAIVVGRSECALHRGWESFTVSDFRSWRFGFWGETGTGLPGGGRHFTGPKVQKTEYPTSGTSR